MCRRLKPAFIFVCDGDAGLKVPLYRLLRCFCALLLSALQAGLLAQRPAALSVASQVKSASLRPKWPYAAVFW